MADTPEPIEQRIQIILETIIENQKEGVKALSQIAKGYKRVGDQAKKQTKMLSGVTSQFGQIADMAPKLGKLTTGFKKMFTVIKVGLASTGIGLFVLAIGQLVTALAGIGGALVKVIKQQKVYVDFQHRMAGGVKTLRELRTSYNQLKQTNDALYVSMRQVAEEMMRFSEMNFSQFIKSGTDTAAVTQSLASIKNAMVDAFGGSDLAKPMMDQLMKVGGMGRATMQSILDAGQQFRDPAQQLKAMAQVLGKMASTDAAKLAIQFQQQADALGRGDGAVETYKNLNKAFEPLSNALDDLKDKFMTTFGPWIAAAAKKMASAIKWIASKMQGLGEVFIKIKSWMVFEWQHLGDSLKALWERAMGGILASLGLLAKGTGKVLSWLGVESGKALQEWGSQKVDAGMSRYRKGLDHVKKRQEYINQQMKEYRKSVAEAGTQMHSNLPEISQLQKLIQDVLQAHDKLVESAYGYTKQLERHASLMTTIGSLVELTGGKFAIAGQTAAAMAASLKDTAIKNAFNDLAQATDDAVGKARQALDQQNDYIAGLQRQIDLQQKGTKEHLRLSNLVEASLEARSTLQEKLNDLIQTRVKGVQGLKQAQDLALKPLQKDLDLLQSQRGVLQAQLDIATNLYGTPALAVENQMQVLHVMERELRTQKQMLATQRQTIKQMMEQGKVSEEELLFARQKELELQEKIRRKQSEMLQKTKELRDGYLDAVKAQFLGQGKFEKIMITQEKNLGIAIDKNMAKMGQLVGFAGKTAKELARGGSYRYTTTPGVLENTQTGQAVSRQELLAHTEKLMKMGSTGKAAAEAQRILARTTDNLERMLSPGNVGSIGSDIADSLAKAKTPLEKSNIELRGAIQEQTKAIKDNTDQISGKGKGGKASAAARVAGLQSDFAQRTAFRRATGLGSSPQQTLKALQELRDQAKKQPSAIDEAVKRTMATAYAKGVTTPGNVAGGAMANYMMQGLNQRQKKNAAALYRTGMLVPEDWGGRNVMHDPAMLAKTRGGRANIAGIDQSTATGKAAAKRVRETFSEMRRAMRRFDKARLGGKGSAGEQMAAYQAATKKYHDALADATPAAIKQRDKNSQIFAQEAGKFLGKFLKDPMSALKSVPDQMRGVVAEQQKAAKKYTDRIAKAQKGARTLTHGLTPIVPGVGGTPAATKAAAGKGQPTSGEQAIIEHLKNLPKKASAEQAKGRLAGFFGGIKDAFKGSPLEHFAKGGGYAKVMKAQDAYDRTANEMKTLRKEMVSGISRRGEAFGDRGWQVRKEWYDKLQERSKTQLASLQKAKKGFFGDEKTVKELQNSIDYQNKLKNKAKGRLGDITGELRTTGVSRERRMALEDERKEVRNQIHQHAVYARGYEKRLAKAMDSPAAKLAQSAKKSLTGPNLLKGLQNAATGATEAIASFLTGKPQTGPAKVTPHAKQTGVAKGRKVGGAAGAGHDNTVEGKLRTAGRLLVEVAADLGDVLDEGDVDIREQRRDLHPSAV